MQQLCHIEFLPNIALWDGGSIGGLGRASPFGWDKEASCESRTPLKGGTRAGSRLGERRSEPTSSDQERKSKHKKALGQLPSA